MSQYYKANRLNNLFDPYSDKPFKISRSKIDLFLNCPRCFYLDRRLGVAQPPGFPFSLNSAVDALLKKEFDIHRAKQTAHPLMEAYGVDAVPFEHPKLKTWRENFKGLQYLHPPTNMLITGAVDDIWVNPKGELIVVDYKATSKAEEVNIDADWQITYKRQMEIYQWLLAKNGFRVSPTGYFVYCNGDTDKAAFDGKLEFDIKLIPYTGNVDWIEKTLISLRDCLMSEQLPQPNPDCDYCAYRRAACQYEK
jgi:CRISPR/Cas system-associated exonuclease Cas4 (RecB family)